MPPRTRLQTSGEEIANSVSHGVGLAGAVVAIPFLVMTALNHGDAGTVWAAVVFGLSILLVYGSSTFYHALPHRGRKAKRLFQLLDHIAIYILIAGSYTPFTLGVLRGSLGWILFGVIWGLAIFGILLKCSGQGWSPWLSTGLYIGMGWLVCVAIVPLLNGLPLVSFGCLVAGGIAYTAGVAFYTLDKRPYAHFVWHLFVLTGTAFHVASVLTMHISGSAGSAGSL
jgi:hemolysin III